MSLLDKARQWILEHKCNSFLVFEREQRRLNSSVYCIARVSLSKRQIVSNDVFQLFGAPPLPKTRPFYSELVFFPSRHEAMAAIEKQTVLNALMLKNQAFISDYAHADTNKGQELAYAQNCKWLEHAGMLQVQTAAKRPL